MAVLDEADKLLLMYVLIHKSLCNVHTVSFVLKHNNGLISLQKKETDKSSSSVYVMMTYTSSDS